MQITAVSNNYYKTNFGMWHRDVYKQINGVEQLTHRNNTSIYRDSTWWIDFGRFLNKFFSGTKQVNVYDWGCSNGSEPTTFVMHMFSNFPKAAKKFTPVFAKDYDPVAIENAKKHELPLDFWEIHRINKYTGGQFLEFFRNIPLYYTDMFFKSESELISYYRKNNVGGRLANSFTAKINEDYAKYINYEISDITTDFKEIKPENSLVMAKNFLPYLGDIKTYELMMNLSKQMKRKSVLVVGGYDLEEIMPLGRHIQKVGFKPAEVFGVYYKP